MPANRIIQTGRDNWRARTGYQHTSRFSSRWERPAGEPSILIGALIIALPVLATAGLIIAL
jgi:hypothetical protein